MLLDRIYLLVVLLAVVVPVYWLVPSRSLAVRRALLVVVSLMALWLIGPTLPLMPLILFGAVAVMAALYRFGLDPGRIRTLSWLLFAPLLLNDVIRSRFDFAPPTAGAGMDMLSLGFGFASLRAFLCVRIMLQQRRFDAGSTLLSLCFFPTYLAGPIAGPSCYESDATAAVLTKSAALQALCRIGYGAALFLVVRPAILGWQSGLDPASVADAWTSVLQRFLGLYCDFSGYTEVAVGVARLFGFTLPENFRAPLLSRSIQDFWNRWHLSLATLIKTYLAQPITRRTGRPHQAIVLAFVLAGMWHAVTPNYLFWGFAHGVMLIVHDRLRHPIARLRLPSLVIGFLGWVTTIMSVATLSAIANAPNAEAGIMVARRLAGWG